MVEPFTIAANVTGQANPGEQDVALIYGAGPMGLVTVQALKGVYKVKQVIVVDRIDERLAMAQRSGADWVFNNGEQSLQAALDEKGIKPTLIIDAACHPSILQEAITPRPAGGAHRADGLLQRTEPDCSAGHHRQRAGDFLLAPERQ